MKIVAILEGDITHGGGFNQALNAVLQMRRLCEGRWDFEVLTDHRPNVAHLAKAGVPAAHFGLRFMDRMLSFLSAQPWWFALQARLRLVSPLERDLLRRGCDLVYLLTPFARTNVLQRLNYMATVWDLCHRDVPEFPEVREWEQFRIRERLYAPLLPAALLVLTDSPRLADTASRRYGVDRERFLPMPFAPAAFLEHGAADGREAVLRKHALEEGYLFYPAQFWPHKNHVRIVQALALLKQRGSRPQVVFAGGDKGNRSHVEAAARQAGVQEQVRFLGFVPAEDMRGLYEGCRAVVMPTYFGPTNIPPLEAWALGKPLVYSSLFEEQVGDAAICVDPDDAESLARGMQACADEAVRARVVEAGRRRLAEAGGQRAEAEAELLRRLQRFAARRACWPTPT